MLIILRPGIIEISLGVYMALVSSFMWSIVIIITKTITKDDSSNHNFILWIHLYDNF
jgi:drug/metabolite transporter (DMT)-like permease